MALNEEEAIECILFPEGSVRRKKKSALKSGFFGPFSIFMSLLAFSPHIYIKPFLNCCGSGLATGTAGLQRQLLTLFYNNTVPWAGQLTPLGLIHINITEEEFRGGVDHL